MLNLIEILIQTLLEVLRKLWQKITGRIPVPVRVRARYASQSPLDLFSRLSVNDSRSSVLDEIRRARW